MGEIEIRNYRPEDSDDLRAMMLAAFEDGELKGSTRSDVERWHSRLPADPGETFVAIVDGDVAGLITPPDNQLIVGRQHRRQGVGGRLVEAAEAFHRKQGTGPLFLWLPHENEAARAFYGALGFRYDHSLWKLRLRDEAVVPEPAFPPIVRSHPYREEDIEAYAGLINTSFLDHPTPFSVSVERIRFAHARPQFDPENICLLSPAEEPGTLIGFCRVVHEEEQGRRTGEVGTLGVLPEWRRLGLGRELLRWGIHRLREFGVNDLYIVVEGENERALNLYEGTGFERVEEWPRYARAVS